MSEDVRQSTAAIPEQSAVPWRIAVVVSWSGVKRRLLRGIITMAGVVLAIAFLTYMLANDSLTKALVDADVPELNVLLQQHGVDIYGGGGADQMMYMLIGLSLLACLVGILNSMIMAVAERVQEIGTLKCLGARDAFIVKTYLIESSLQGILGAVSGAVFGALVAFGVAVATYHGYAVTYLPVLEFLTAMGIGLVTGAALAIIASIAPAYMAARKQPVDAMRVEE